MMNQADIFRKIGNILNELTEQYEFLSSNPEQLNELELELFLANASFLSDHIDIIRRLSMAKPQKQLPEHTAPATPLDLDQDTLQDAVPDPTSEGPLPVNTPVVDDLPEPKDYTFFEKPADLVEYVKEESPEVPQSLEKYVEETEAGLGFEFDFSEPASGKFEFEEKPVTQIFDRELSEEEQRIIAEKQRLQEQKEREQAAPAPAPDPAPTPLASPAATAAPDTTTTPAAASLFSEDKPERKVVAEPTPAAPAAEHRPTLNDLLAARANPNTSPAAQQPKTNPEAQAKPPITDLKGAVTLNEKLLYIKDLFNGYNLAYSEAIELINKMPDLKTADAFLKNNYAEKNNWQAKQTTVDQFYELLSRRFPNG